MTLASSRDDLVPTRRKTRIYLADLTHTGQIVSANAQPLGIGLIAAYALKHLAGEIEVELFKYPDDLARALETCTPDVVGFSNYCWNQNLAYDFTRLIKQAHPDTVIIFGGPNYGMTESEIESFWKRYPLIDFYLVKEGESAFVEVLRELRAVDCGIAAIKSEKRRLPNTHYMTAGGDFVEGPLLPRIRDLGAIPSPYLEGLMDKFFDPYLVPLIHTTRGCPFTCTFCTEGDHFYAKVAKRYDLDEELEYIAKRVPPTVPDLQISDANFGMFKEDESKARSIARIYEQYGWPKHIQVSGGKNQKERLMNVAKILGGRMDISASMQSTAPDVLANVRRKNISYGELSEVGNQSREINARSFVEIILGLPGDTIEKHTQSLVDSMNSGVNLVRMHQLMLLPQTEMVTPESRTEYGLETRYRVAARSFGRYSSYGKEFVSVEHDEMCLAQNSMTANEYIEARMLDLSVEILYNGWIYREIYDLCGIFSIKWTDLVFKFHDQRFEISDAISALYERFEADSWSGLWDNVEDLERHVKENLEHYIETSEGVNQLAISNAKARACFDMQEDIHMAIYRIFSEELEAGGVLSTKIADYLGQMSQYHWLRKKDLLNVDLRTVQAFDYDFAAKFNLDDPTPWQTARLTEPRFYVFEHDREQRDTIRGYVNQYGETLAGFGRVLMKIPFHRIIRDGVPLTGTLNHDGVVVPLEAESRLPLPAS